MFLQSGPLGVLGLITDPPAHLLPLGAWPNCNNVRFRDSSIERVLEPIFVNGSEPVADNDPIWAEQWVDDEGPQIVYASKTRLFKLNANTKQWDDVSQGGGDYQTSDYWQSFAWGRSVVFNNASNPPQILYPGASEFQDLPNWGIISSNPANPQQDVDTIARCQVLRPYGNFLVAINCRENAAAQDFPNRVWASGPASQTDDPDPARNPSWDYADLGSLSSIRTVAAEDGPLIDQLTLGAVNMLYTQYSATAMQLTGDSQTVFNYDRALDYGIANIHAVANYSNYHFCVGIDTVFIHDGSNVNQVIDGRVQETFYGIEPVIGEIQVEHYQREKEVHVLLGLDAPDEFGNKQKKIITYNYKDDNFSQWDAFTGQGQDREYIACLSYGSRTPTSTTWQDLTDQGITWADLTAQGITWADFSETPEGQELFWCNSAGLWATELDPSLSPDKQYFLERPSIDLSELDPSLTSNKWKMLRQMYPHIDSDGDGSTQITVGWSNTLTSAPQTVETFNYSPELQIKADFRKTGRYLYTRFDVVGDGSWRMSSMDYDITVLYGR